MTGSPPFECTLRTAVDYTLIRTPNKIRKATVGVDASQLYPFPMCQEMTTGLYTRYELNSDMQSLKVFNIVYFETTVVQFLKLSYVTIFSVLVENLSALLARTSFSMAFRSLKMISYKTFIWRKKDIKLFRWWSMNGGMRFVEKIFWKISSEKILLTNYI